MILKIQRQVTFVPSIMEACAIFLFSLPSDLELFRHPNSSFAYYNRTPRIFYPAMLPKPDRWALSGGDGSLESLSLPLSSPTSTRKRGTGREENWIGIHSWETTGGSPPCLAGESGMPLKRNKDKFYGRRHRENSQVSTAPPGDIKGYLFGREGRKEKCCVTTRLSELFWMQVEEPISLYQEGPQWLVGRKGNRRSQTRLSKGTEGKHLSFDISARGLPMDLWEYSTKESPCQIHI